MSTIGDDLLRESGEPRRRLALRPADRGAGRLQQQPGGGGAAVGARSPPGFAPRRPVHGGARALPDRHRRPRRLRAAGDHAARAPRPADQLRPHLRADQRAGDRAARRGPAEHRDLPRPGGDDGLRRALLRRQRRGSSRAIAFKPAAQGGFDFADLREHGWRKLDIAEAPFADGGFATPSGKCRIDAPGLGVPDHVPNYESAASTPELAAAFRWR